MRNVFICLMLIWCVTAIGQTPDTLVKLGGRKIPANILNITSTTVYYSLPQKPRETLRIDRKDLEKAIMRSGRVEPFNKPAFQMIQDGQWEAVLVTEDIKETEGLYKRKVISAKSTPSDTKKKARQNAISKLQKQAANAGGCIVYITKTAYYGGYGDPAGCDMEGIAYGVQPLEEGTDVIKDSSEKDKNNTTKPETKTNDTKTTTPVNNQKTSSTSSPTTTPVTKTVDNKTTNQQTTGVNKTTGTKTTTSPKTTTTKPK